MVKVLNTEAINRMVGGRSSITGSGGGGYSGNGGGGSDFNPAAYANRSWVDDYYVGKSFLSSMTKAYDANGNEIKPNDVASTIANINITKTLVLSKVQDASGSADNGPALIVGGTRSQAHIEIDNNEIIAKSGATGVATLWLNDNGGEVVVSGDLTVDGGEIVVNNSSGSSVLNFQTNATTKGNIRVNHSNGEMYYYTGSGDSTLGIINASSFNSPSDERKKDVIGDISLTVEQIANARAVVFKWKDQRDQNLHIGSIAQDWKKILPHLVYEDNGELSMDYGGIALMSAITIAKAVTDYENRIKRLEDIINSYLTNAK